MTGWPIFDEIRSEVGRNNTYKISINPHNVIRVEDGGDHTKIHLIDGSAILVRGDFMSILTLLNRCDI